MAGEPPWDVVDIPPLAEMEYASVLLSAILATNASSKPGRVAVIADAVGKSAEPVTPTTKAFPLESIAIPFPKSLLLPPRYVAHAVAEPDAFSFAANASVTTSDPPPNVDCTALAIGKFVELVLPAT